MQKIGYSFIASLLLLVIACDNDVDLNAEYEDTTVVYGLINAYEDTQFVKINRAFLEDGSNAVQLAKESDRFFYDNLDVKLIRTNKNPNDTFQLKTISKRKDPGVFSNDQNIVYFTDTNIAAEADYKLEIRQKDGKLITSTTKTLKEISVIRPPYIQSQMTRRVSLFNLQRGIQDYDFTFNLTSNISEISAKLYFLYDEEINGQSIPRSVEIPIGGFLNGGLENRQVVLALNGESFYNAIAAQVPKNGNLKRIQGIGNLRIEIVAVDPIFNQYKDIYGPLDGLAQVRPEYTNIVNGIGLFSSRSTTRESASLTDDSRSQILNGSVTGDLNFTD